MVHDDLVVEGDQVVEDCAAVAQDSEDAGNLGLLNTLEGQVKIACEETVQYDSALGC